MKEQKGENKQRDTNFLKVGHLCATIAIAIGTVSPLDQAHPPIVQHPTKVFVLSGTFDVSTFGIDLRS